MKRPLASVDLDFKVIVKLKFERYSTLGTFLISLFEIARLLSAPATFLLTA